MKQKQMSGRHRTLKCLKGKCRLRTRGSNKGTVKRNKVKKPRSAMPHSKPELSFKDSSDYASSRPENFTPRHPHSSSECQGREKQPKCGAAPDRGEKEGKENCVRPDSEQNYCTTDSFSCNMEGENTERSVQIGKNVFPDDNSNQIFPVEQFFGNLEVVQDCPQKPAISSTRDKREQKRRRYYAKEESDEERCSHIKEDDSEKVSTHYQQ